MTSKTADNKKGFYIKIVLPSALAVILFVVTLFYIVIPAFENAMMDRKREMITQLTNAATSILDKYYNDETAGLLSREEAQKTSVARLQYLRYGDDNKDYFWITDTMPVMIMHPYRPELNGEDLSDFEDSHGKKLFVESVKIAREHDHGYVNYMWQWKDDSVHIVPKLSYVKAFKPWGWVVGTGIYIEDVKKEISSLTRKFVHISLLISLITALILFYVGRQSLRIENQRRKAESELEESREKYKSLVDASTEGFLILIDGHITFTNSVLKEMTGIDAEDMMNKPLSQIIHLPQETIIQLSEIHYHAFFEPIETFLYKASGEALPVLLNISPVIFSGKDAVILSIKDLSYDEQIKEELLQNKEKFKALMDKLNIGIFRTTIDLKGRFLEANETALNLLGYKNIEELSDKYILDIFTDVDDKKSFRNNLIEKGFIKNQTLKLKRKNGQLIVASVSLVVVEEDKTPKFCDGIVEVISENKKNTDINDNIINEYTGFTQQLYRMVKDFSTEVTLVNYNDLVTEAAMKMTEDKTDFAVVVSESMEMLGVITDKDIRERAIDSISDNSAVKAFEIMSSPVISVKPDILLFEALLLFDKHNINHLVVKDNAGKVLGVSGKNLGIELYAGLPSFVHTAVGSVRTLSNLVEIKNKYIHSLLPLMENNIKPAVVFRSLSVMSDALTNKIIEFALKELGSSPVDFCFISLGSDARQEQTFSTDQDNALIFEDVAGDKIAEVYEYFNKFSDLVCTMLNEAGYNYCKGNVMAMNKDWCQPVSIWKSYFKKWINTGTAKDLLDINIFFDIRSVYGKSEFVSLLQDYIFDLTRANPAYLYHLTQNTLMLKPHVGFWGNISLESSGAPPETVNIKDSIMPIVNFARIYALKSHIITASTYRRLDILQEQNILNSSTYTNTIQALDYLNHIRLQHQGQLLRNKLKPDNLINTNSLSELDKTILKKVISNINNMLSKLSFDFKGSY